MNITDAQKQQFQEEGYFILENVIPEPFLELLRGECGTFINQADAEMERQDARTYSVSIIAGNGISSQTASGSNRNFANFCLAI